MFKVTEFSLLSVIAQPPSQLFATLPFAQSAASYKARQLLFLSLAYVSPVVLQYGAVMLQHGEAA